MNAVNMERDQWQMGKSKVFIKAPESVRYYSNFNAFFKQIGDEINELMRLRAALETATVGVCCY